MRALSWNLEGTRLLLGGRLLQLWAKSASDSHYDINAKNAPQCATFHVGPNYDDSEDEGKDKGRSSKKENSKSPTADDGRKIH